MKLRLAGPDIVLHSESRQFFSMPKNVNVKTQLPSMTFSCSLVAASHFSSCWMFKSAVVSVFTLNPNTKRDWI